VQETKYKNQDYALKEKLISRISEIKKVQKISNSKG
jgi:hypothetical protein